MFIPKVTVIKTSEIADDSKGLFSADGSKRLVTVWVKYLMQLKDLI